MLAVDWSGDPGLQFGPASSNYFALSLVSFDPEEVSDILAGLRKQQGLPERFEYHFAHGPSKANGIRQGFMNAFVRSSISVHLLVVDKAALPKPPQFPRGIDFVAQQLCSLVLAAPQQDVENAVMLIDGKKDETAPLCKIARVLLSQEMTDCGLSYRLKNIRPAESHRWEGIMVADMTSGAARHSGMGKTPNYLAPLKHKTTINKLP